MALDRKSADLHIHSTASDGSLRPAQVVERAHAAGLAAIGIADHDTVDGITEAISAGERLGIEVVPAVEINTDIPGKEAHVLGYFIDIECGGLHKELAKLREARLRRGEKMVANLREVGVPVTMERVLEIADGAPIARPHVARAIVETGAVRSLASAFGRFLIPGAPGYVARYKFSPAEAIRRARVDHAAQLLCDTLWAMPRIAAACGFERPELLTRAFRRELMVTPSEFRRQHLTGRLGADSPQDSR